MIYPLRDESILEESLGKIVRQIWHEEEVSFYHSSFSLSKNHIGFLILHLKIYQIRRIFSCVSQAHKTPMGEGIRLINRQGRWRMCCSAKQELESSLSHWIPTTDFSPLFFSSYPAYLSQHLFGFFCTLSHIWIFLLYMLRNPTFLFRLQTDTILWLNLKCSRATLPFLHWLMEPWVVTVWAIVKVLKG